LGRKRRKHHSRSRSRSHSRERTRNKKKKKTRRGRSPTPDTKRDDPEGETEEQYDARLEREEKERIATRKLRDLEALKRRHEQSSVPEGGVRFKGMRNT
jgi:peptidyl-prolyl isomerase G (cyclophilin G)